MPRFGYPPMKRPQHQFNTSYTDFANQTTQSMDVTTWTNNDSYDQRSSGSENVPRENLSPRRTDSMANKPPQCE